MCLYLKLKLGDGSKHVCCTYPLTFYNLSFERPIPYLHISTEIYIYIYILDKHASHKFKYLYLFQVKRCLKPWKKKAVLLWTKMHLALVSQLVTDFHFKDILSTNKINIYLFFLLLSSLFHCYQGRSFQFSPKNCKMKAEYITTDCDWTLNIWIVNEVI